MGTSLILPVGDHDVSKAKPPKPLPKKLVFAAEFLKDRNATQAAIRAGYSAPTAHAAGERLLRDHEVAVFIAKHTEKVIERAEVDAARVLKEIHLAAFFDPEEMYREDGTLKNIPDMPEHIRRAIAAFEVVETFEMQGEGKDRRRVWTGYTKKVKLVSKEGTLTLAARHLGMLHDNVSVKVDSVVDALQAAEQRAKQAE